MESQIKKRLDDSYKIHQLESELYKVKKRADRFAECFLEAVDSIEETMHEIFAQSNYASDDFEDFCKDRCPFEKCELDCFSKEREDRCENKNCGSCPDKYDCEDNDDYYADVEANRRFDAAKEAWRSKNAR